MADIYQPVSYGLTPDTAQVPAAFAKQFASWGYQPSMPDPNKFGDYSLTSGGVPQLNAMATNPAAPAASPFMDWLRSTGAIGTTDAKGIKTDGWGGLALGAATGLGSLYMGMQQYNLAKDSLANSKAQFERNFAANKTTVNADMQDRQRARVASNAGAYQSVGDYMAANGVR